MLADTASGGAIACCLVKSCPAGNLPFADLTQATTFIDFAPCTIIILPCVATGKAAREARAVAELRGILQQEASLLDKRGLSVWRIRQDALTVIGKMSILGFRLAEFGVNAVDGVHTWNLVCHDDSTSALVPPPMNNRQHQQAGMMMGEQQHTAPVRGQNAMYDSRNHPVKAGRSGEFAGTANTSGSPLDADPRPQQSMASASQNQDNFLSSSYAESSPRRNYTNSNIVNSTAAGGSSRFSSSSGSARSTRTAQQAGSSNAFETQPQQQSGRSSGNVSTSSLTDSTGMQYDNNLLTSRRGAPTMLAPASFSRPKIINQQNLMAGGTMHTNNVSSSAGVGASAIRRMSSTGSVPTMASSSTTGGGGGAKKGGSKKRKKKSLGLGRSKSRKRIPSNFGPLHPRTAALLETRRSNLVPEELKAEQHDELVPLLERVQTFLSANPQLGLRPRWRLLQPIGHPHCTAHFKCTTHVKGASIMCPARIAVGLDRVTRRYHITYEMISHECQQFLGNSNTNAVAAGAVRGSMVDDEVGDEDDDLMTNETVQHEGDMESTGISADDADYDADAAEDADDNDGGNNNNAEDADDRTVRQNTLTAADENDLSGNMSIKIDEEAHNEMMMNDDRSESPWPNTTAPTVSFAAANDEARE